jgi:hypothetical protein
MEADLVRYWGRKSQALAEKYISRFAPQNGIVADFFGGSGVFVKTALELQRRAVYIDLNPFAYLLAKSTIVQCDNDEFAAAVNEVLKQEEVEVKSWKVARIARSKLFSIRCACGRESQVSSVVYGRKYEAVLTDQHDLTDTRSSIYRSISGHRYILHEDLVRLHPAMRSDVLSNSVKWLVRKGYVSETEYPLEARFVAKCKCGREYLCLNGKINWIFSEEDISPAKWYPDNKLQYVDSTTFLKKRDAERMSDFFTKRNLAALASIWSCIKKLNVSSGVRDCLRLTFMATLVRSSKMCRTAGGPWPVNSYWVPRTYKVRNPYVVFAEVSTQFSKMLSKQIGASTGSLSELLDNRARITFFMADSTKLRLPLGSVDYVIIDPPHTDEVQYLELSSFYTSWLKESLHFDRELIINRKQGKNETVYLRMLREATLRIYTALRKGGHCSVILSGNNRRVHGRCVNTICDAGFRLVERRRSEGYIIFTFKK